MKLGRLSVYVPLLLLLFGAWPAFANTITVTNTDDSGVGSLRNAIAMALPGDTITFSLTYPATITLHSTLNINTSLTISGPGASNLAISGNNATEVIHVSPETTVGIAGLTIENGAALFGGGINNSGTLTLTDSTLSANASPYYGGSIYNSGVLTITNSTLSNNVANYYGGAIYNNNGTVTLANNTVSGNSTSYEGGGIYNYTGTLTATNSTVSGNTAHYGGGIYNFNHGTLTLTNSTVSGNSASNDGGGIYNYSNGTATVANSTISGNSSIQTGGGMLNVSQSMLAITESTVAGNSAGNGGGIYNNSNSTLLLKSTVVANSSGGNCSLPGGVATSDGYNLSDDASCSAFLTSVTDQNNVVSLGLDPGGLQNNGGPTKTIALLSTSPAVDAIPVADCTLADETTTVATDQRGVKRPQGPACDIGAFELVESVPFSYFSAKLDIPGGSSFDLNSKFILGAGSSGINPLTEIVKLQVGPFVATIPTNSFHQLEHGEKKGSYVFSGAINGAWISIQIVPLGEDSYQFKATGSAMDFRPVTNPVTVTLTFGEDTGTTAVNVDSDHDGDADGSSFSPERVRDSDFSFPTNHLDCAQAHDRDEGAPGCSSDDDHRARH
jgi:Chlamydia polymorphic membrane protein (Chlamydia_PMP) repeat